MVRSRWFARRLFPYPANRFTPRLYGRHASFFLTWTNKRPDLIPENLGGWRAMLAERPALLRQERLDHALGLGVLA